MKKIVTLIVILFTCFCYLSFTGDENKSVAIPSNPQTIGDAEKGYQYLITGDYLKSGFPITMFSMIIGKDTNNYLQRQGLNKNISHEFTALKAPNGEMIVTANCLRCHGQVFENKLYVGLGNSMADFSDSKEVATAASNAIALLSMMGGKSFNAAKDFLNATQTIGPYIKTEVRGVNAADRLTAILAAHRDPVTLQWSDKALLSVPDEVIPTDVPAWWLLKKKNAMFYNGFGRGDFAKFLMGSSLLTMKDSAEASEVYSHFSDVLAYIYSLQPPKYPGSIDEALAANGKALFGKNCARCHGTYGDDGKYPNLLIPASIIGTDSALYNSNYSSPQFVDWFNKSWFTQGDKKAQLIPFKGYIAPPLDGIWITAPYLHNGSVPTLEGVLNSDSRPQYWSRDFVKPLYDFDAVGWKHTILEKETKGAYNTTLKGYGNHGHFFGDAFSDKERKAVIEYLKTL